MPSPFLWVVFSNLFFLLPAVVLVVKGRGRRWAWECSTIVTLTLSSMIYHVCDESSYYDHWCPNGWTTAYFMDEYFSYLYVTLVVAPFIDEPLLHGAFGFISHVGVLFLMWFAPTDGAVARMVPVALWTCTAFVYFRLYRLQYVEQVCGMLLSMACFAAGFTLWRVQGNSDQDNYSAEKSAWFHGAWHTLQAFAMVFRFSLLKDASDDRGLEATCETPVELQRMIEQKRSKQGREMVVKQGSYIVNV